MEARTTHLRGRMKTEDKIFLFDYLEAANDFIKCHEIETNTRFVIGQVEKNFGKSAVNPSIRKVNWVHGLHPYMYVILGRKLLRCHHGPDKNKKQKLEKAETKKVNTDAHTYTKKKTRHAVQPTKKMDCPAIILLKEVLIFTPEKDTTSEVEKKQAASAVRNNLSKGVKKIMVVFPSIEHQNHTVGENAGLSQRIDDVVASKIEELVVESGVTNVEEMQRHISAFVKKTIVPTPLKTNRRFRPTNKSIRNHMNKAAKQGLKSSDDQDNLVELLNETQAACPDALLHVRRKQIDANGDSETHPSVRMKGTEANYQPEQCFDGACSDHPPHMHCPFCVKSDCYTDPVILKAHYRVKHVDKGIEFAGLKILRCCAQCEIVGVIKGEKRFKGAHWHCYKCRNGFNRRDEAIKHYKTHFRNPQTTFQIQIAQDTNQPVTQGFETEEAAASIPVDTFTVHSVNSSLPVMTTYAQAGSEMLHRGMEEMVTGVGAIETVGLSDTQTIMIIQDETHSMHDTSQDLSNASSMVSDSGGDPCSDPRLEMQVKDLQQRVAQLEQELLDREAVIRDLQAKVSASKVREQELMDQLATPTNESLQELCTSLQLQHSELIRNQLKLVQQAVLKNHNQNKKSQTKMIIINPVGASLSASGLMNSSQDVINSVLNSGLTLHHGSQALAVSLAGTLSTTASSAAEKNRVSDAEGDTGEGHQIISDTKDLMEHDFAHAAERMAQTDTVRRPARKKAKLFSQSDVELQNA